MEELTLAQISHPKDPSKKIVFLLQEKFEDEFSAIRGIVYRLLSLFSQQELVHQLDYAFKNTQRFGDKRCASNFWDKLNKMTGEKLDDIEDFSSYIQNIKDHKELILYIFDLPNDTIKYIIFTLLAQYKESFITLG